MDSDFTVLVGKNNAGKSNIVAALSILLDSKNPKYVALSQDDYNDPTSPIELEVEFDGFTWGSAKQVGLSDAQVRALFNKPSKKTHRDPGRATLRFHAPALVPSDDGDDDRIVTLRLANATEVKRPEMVRRRLVQFVAIPPLRSESDLLKPTTWTAYGRFLRDIIDASPDAENLARLIGEASATLRQILEAEAKVLTETAKLTAYVDEVLFRFTREGEPAELLRNLSLAVRYGARIDEIGRVGTGTQSAVIMGVMELAAKRKTGISHRVFIVEEPELYLHPNGQRYVSRLLQSLAQEAGCQVIVTSHSPAVLLGAPATAVARVDRDEVGCTKINRLLNTAESALRILNAETAEMFFADRVVLVEGASEAFLVPRLARALAGEDPSCDPDRNNVTYVAAGGKESFRIHTSVLDALGIRWKILADRDALAGDSLSEYKKAWGISATEGEEDQIAALRRQGIAVLSDGEIEDYYPDEALASIAGCEVHEVSEELDSRRAVFEEVACFKLIVELLERRRDDLLSCPPERLPKVAKIAYDQTLSDMRNEGLPTTNARKTGDAMSLWLKMPKPTIALRVANWIAEDPARMPERLRAIVKWTVRAD